MRRGERGTERARKVWGATAAAEIGSRVFPLRGPPGPMPSVGTRRSTRVFVPKAVAKPGGSGRNLRSGKRVVLSEHLGKKSDRDADVWLGVFGGNGGQAGLRWWRSDEEAEDLAGADSISIEPGADQLSESACLEALDNTPDRKLFGIVFSRKRRRSRSEKGSSDRKYGIVFTRKLRKKRLKGASLFEEIWETSETRTNEHYDVSSRRVTADWDLSIGASARDFAEKVGIMEGDVIFRSCRPVMLTVLIDSGRSSSSHFAAFFSLVLRWLGRAEERFQEFVSFLFSGSIANVFSRHGIHLLPLQHLKFEVFPRGSGSPRGLCLIYGALDFVPLVSLDFSALPTYFKSLHVKIALGSLYLPCCLGNFLRALNGKVRNVGGFEGNDSQVPLESSCSGNELGASALPIVKRDMASGTFKPMPTVGRNALIVHGLRMMKHQRKRSSLRHSRIWNPSPLELRGGALSSDQNGSHMKPHQANGNVLSVREGIDVSSPHGSNKRLSKSVKRSTADRIKEIRMRAALASVKENIDSERCNVNILVTTADRCWRVVGAEVMLELSGTNTWCLAVKSQGFVQYMHKPQELRPPVVNRFTHDYMWSGDEGWKLEFTDRWDWLVFKELHVECQQRNVGDVPSKVIPVPVVQQVLSYEDDTTALFSRPDAYVMMMADEVERAMTSEVSYYDMDSGDEEWLEQLNARSLSADLDRPSDDNFEKIMFSLEKEAYSHPDDSFDLDKALHICQGLGNRDLVAAVFDYWIEKRKQKGAALVKVFQGQPVRRPRLLQQHFLRKKRSFKRQRSQDGRGRTEYFFEDGAKHEAHRRVQDAEAAAKRAVDSAIRLRSRAQLYMANAELLAYKSAMALKLAEAISVSSSPDLTSSILE
ncbi:putative enhancer of polycomb protein [Dioscorea sansibarensis]